MQYHSLHTLVRRGGHTAIVHCTNCAPLVHTLVCHTRTYTRVHTLIHTLVSGYVQPGEGHSYSYILIYTHTHTLVSGYVQPGEGHSSCGRCLSNEYIQLESLAVGFDNKTCVSCPLVGLNCDGTTMRTYAGQFYHSPAVINPDRGTQFYVCVVSGVLVL
jgi:hypothetical protein